MPHTRRAWRIDRAGSLDRLTLRTETLADPGAGEARVSIRAIGLNFADIFACLGLYSATPSGSFVPGLEFAGIVEELGPPALPGDDRSAGNADPAGREVGVALKPGDRVAGLTRFGAYASAVNVRTQYLRPIRDGWSFADAAAYPVQGLTAMYGLVRLAGVQRGDVVLVQSAAGGVGLQALSIVHALGATPIATVGGEAKRAFLVEHRGLAPAQIIVRDRRRFGAQLDSALASVRADGFHAVFDALAGPYFRPSYDRLRPEGRMVVYGAADYMASGSRANYLKLAVQYLRRPRIDPLAMMSQNRSVMGFNLIWLWDRVDRLPLLWDALDILTPSPPLVGRSFAFEHARAAMRHLQSGQSVGKVVLVT